MEKFDAVHDPGPGDRYGHDAGDAGGPGPGRRREPTAGGHQGGRAVDVTARVSGLGTEAVTSGDSEQVGEGNGGVGSVDPSGGSEVGQPQPGPGRAASGWPTGRSTASGSWAMANAVSAGRVGQRQRVAGRRRAVDQSEIRSAGQYGLDRLGAPARPDRHGQPWSRGSGAHQSPGAPSPWGWIRCP